MLGRKSCSANEKVLRRCVSNGFQQSENRREVETDIDRREVETDIENVDKDNDIATFSFSRRYRTGQSLKYLIERKQLQLLKT